MTEERKQYLQHAFKWGSVIGFLGFILHLVGFYTKWETSELYNEVFFFVEIILLCFMFSTYARMLPDKAFKFKRMFIIGFVAAATVAAFETVFVILRMQRLDPLFFQNYMQTGFEYIKQNMHIDYAKMITPEMLPMFKVGFIISIFFGNLINNTFTIIFIALLYKLNDRMMRNFRQRQ